MKTITILAMTAALSGCSTLRAIEPDTLPIEITHVSHLTQHMQPGPTHYGYDSVSLGAKWYVTRHLSVTLSEGFILESRKTWTDSNTGEQIPLHGGLLGPKEVFTGRISYEVPLK